MEAHPHILDEPEPLGKPFLGSLVIHVSVFCLLLISPLFRATKPNWGDVAAGGGAVAITPVHTIPIPAKAGEINRLANDTQSIVPQAPPKAKEQRQVKLPDPKAIPIPSREAPKRTSPASTKSVYRPHEDLPPNQVFSSTPQALKSPMIGQSGPPGIDIGPNSQLGNRFGYYVGLLRERIASKWNTADVSAPANRRAMISFTISRDGTVRDVRLAESSGSYTLDQSAQRAVLDANPLPPLPAAFDKNEVTVDFWFQLRQ